MDDPSIWFLEQCLVVMSVLVITHAPSAHVTMVEYVSRMALPTHADALWDSRMSTAGVEWSRRF